MQFIILPLIVPDVHFVKSFNIGPYVYFFFRERSLEDTSNGKVKISRVARICQVRKNTTIEQQYTYLLYRGEGITGNTPLVKFIRNYIRERNGVFSISSCWIMASDREVNCLLWNINIMRLHAAQHEQQTYSMAQECWFIRKIALSLLTCAVWNSDSKSRPKIADIICYFINTSCCTSIWLSDCLFF